jgi:hypothetical protein
MPRPYPPEFRARALALEALYRGFAVQHRGDDVAVLGDRLAADRLTR